MVLRSDFSDDALVAFARTLADRVNRNALQQMLVEARLLPRLISRDDLRRACPTSAIWITSVRRALAAPESRPAALRALSLLVSAYMSSSATDHRVETAVRKARQGAERGDLPRISREFQKLQEYSIELDSPELQKPDLLLFICAGSDRARDSVAQAIESVGIASEPAAKEPVTENRASTMVRSEVGPSIHATEEPTPQRVATELSSELVGRINQLGQSDPVAIQWNTEALVKGRAPGPEVQWPDTQPVFVKTKSLVSLLRLQAQACDSINLSSEDFASLKDGLSGCSTLLSEALNQLLADVEKITQDTNATIETVLGSLQPELSDRAAQVRKRLANKEEVCPKREAIDLLKANEELLAGKVMRVCASVKGLEQLAPYLPTEAQHSLEVKARHLAIHLRTEEIERLLQDTEARTEEPRRVRQRIKEAAQQLLDFLTEIEVKSLSSELIDRVEEAVREGDGDRATSIIKDFLSQNHEIPASDTQTILQNSEYPRSDSLSVPPSSAPAEDRFEADLKNFTPRDRLTARDPQLPSQSHAMIVFLRDHCLAAIKRNSVAAAIDHALDILLLAGNAQIGTQPWSEAGLAVLASLPAGSLEAANWGQSLAESLRDSLGSQDSSTLRNYLGNLILQPDFEEAISERFVHSELVPFVDTLGLALHASVSIHRPYLLEDVARAIGAGVAYGDQVACKTLLLSLARAAGEGSDTLHHAEKWLDNERAYSTATERNRVSDWIAEGIKAYHAALGDRNKTPFRTPSRGSTLRLQVPPSVSRSGGFGFLPGSDEIEFGLLLSNQQSRPISSVEVSLPKVRNPWLSDDVLYSTGPLSANSRHLLQIKARLQRELTTDTTFEAGWQVRFREPGNRDTKFEDGRIEKLSFANSRSLVIQNYEGAGGKPLILEGDTLRYSSNTVKRALSEILSGLSGRGIAALVIGRRRRGKTSILQTVAQHKDVRARYTVISDAWEDLPSRNLTGTLQHLGMVFDRAARTLGIDIESLEHRLNIDTSSGWSVFQHWIDDLTSRLKSPVRLLLLLDEFQKWITLLDPESRTRILYILRGLFNRPESGTLSISIVLSGLTNIREFTRASADFENAFQIFSIEAFTLAETDSLIRSNASIEFDSRAVARIRDLAGGNPFLINLLCNDIASRLRELGRAYCLPEDVERVVKAQLEDRENSRVWSFLQYLLKEGEEDHASEIPELPTLLALGHTRRMRGTGRSFIGTDEIVTELRAAEVVCDRDTLAKHLASAVRHELIVQRGQRYAFANGWLAEWLSVNENLVPITPEPDKELVLGRFRLIDFVDRGGQASVYEAQDTRASNRPVIVKIYPRTQASGMSNSVMREAKLLHSIEHTAVVQCIDYGSDPEKGDVIVLERVKGEKLRDLLTSRPKHANDLIGKDGNLRVQVKFIEQIAAALCECHRVGVVHKDIKPENIMVQAVAGLWLPKIIDFGLASYLSETNSDVRTKGSYTPGYVAPERYRGEGRRAPADMYSVGVVAYELLTGRPPFPEDLLAVREAQEHGTFVPAKDVRPEIPLRLSELLSEMMSPDPAVRPNAFTLVGRLVPSLETSDWTADVEHAKKAYLEGDAETACNYFERAAFAAPEAGRRTKEYIEALSYLVDTADSCGRLLLIAPELIQPIVAAAVQEDAAVGPFEQLVAKVLAEPAVDPGKRETQRSTVHTLVELLNDVVPNARLLKGAELLLRSADHPSVWPDREEVFLLGLAYKDSGLIPLAMVGQWCLAAAKKLRERDGNLLSAQIWLRRAERIGVGASAEYRTENEALLKLIRQTATPAVLPVMAQQEPPSSTVGDGERAHLNVGRIQTWVGRLLKLHPYVQGVRRVKRDPNLPLTPTRILSLGNIAQHLTSGSEAMEAARIIPAVLDESYCIPKGTTALRINIVLPPKTTIAQREAVITLLADDNSLFGVS